MKSWGTCIVVSFYCMIGGACIGASTHWNDSGGCMFPAPLTGIVYAVAYGGMGLLVGAVLCPVTASIKTAIEEGHKTQQTPQNREEAHSLLLRPSSTVAGADQTLLRPSEGSKENDPASLLRASDKTDAGR